MRVRNSDPAYPTLGVLRNPLAPPMTEPPQLEAAAQDRSVNLQAGS